MPKTKTHKGISKRVRLTGKGKIVKESANRQHLFEHKSSRRTRRLDGTSSVSKADLRKIKKLLKI